ncbi:MAG: nuclear transport factor 2 family protein [Acidobacteriota bacterium]|nr:nuclear transport factor 2 family protein [Acidobacteriota bacterium]
MPTTRAAVSAEKRVLDANGRLYQALESKNMAGIQSIWWHDEWVQCLHPGWPLVRGWRQIEESFSTIFRLTTQLSVTVSQPLVHVCGNSAWVSSTEQITMVMGGEFIATRVEATNLLERRGAEWRLVNRHTTPVPGAGFVEGSQSVH